MSTLTQLPAQVEPSAIATPPSALAALRHECDQLQILVDVTNAVLSKLDIGELVEEIAQAIHHIYGIDFVSLNIFDEERINIEAHSVFFEHEEQRLQQYNAFARQDLPAHQAPLNGQIFTASRQDIEQLALRDKQFASLSTKDFQSVCILPLFSGNKPLGALLLAHKRQEPIFAANQSLLQQIAARISLALDNALAYREISHLKDRLAHENLFLTEEIRHYQNFDEIIGQSAALSAVLEQVEMVANSDSTVLILGETGTGKELIARAIHKLSQRKKQRMVTMNCAAIPANLLESDLFGHEKGAFTGATTQRTGRFEMADRGTLFLDEVGDIPLELQPKLLRVLQEHEIERLGGQKIIPVDARVIAATNCNLQEMVADKRYRSDLYYRLNVFPIIMPPLRDRPEDIPLLAQFFTMKFAQRMNRTIESIPTETIARLMRHPWPGNVRELQNIIERAVILTRGSVLNLPLSELQYDIAPLELKPAPRARATTSDAAGESELQLITRVLKETNGIVAGPKGAAARLGLKRTTLLSRMQRLGISAKALEDSEI